MAKTFLRQGSRESDFLGKAGGGLETAAFCGVLTPHSTGCGQTTYAWGHATFPDKALKTLYS